MALVAAILVLGATHAAAGTYTLRPSGYGPNSYASWKAQQGEPDSTGSDNQALYLQKMVPTATNAAGVAIIQGFEGQPLSSLSSLAWDHRVDGHCGAGAPRWVIATQDASGTRHFVFLGCAASVHSPTGDPNWIRDSNDQTAISAAAAVAGASSSDTIIGLGIVFDEGNDQGQGYVYLDNITVNNKVWTSANDNGNA
ncbi:MAG: hypothetical protein M3290_08885 [Actinomycetota bacterium]|nr:hypothetical protein [Actinomycetota bacterium]